MEPPDPDTTGEIEAGKPIMTLGDLLDSPLVGLLEDLDDPRDSAQIARALRDAASQRWAR